MDQGLTERTLGGLLWVGVGKAAGAVLRLLVLVVLARLLSPGDFGVMSAALVVIGLALIFSQLGLGPAIVQRAKLETRHLQTAFTASVALGVALGGLVWWSAPAAARFFTDVAGLEPVLRALSWLFPLGGLSVVAASLLQRELRFRMLATVDVVTFAVGYGGVGVTLGALGFGVWALVWAQLAQSALNTAILLAARPPFLRALPDRRALAELLYFGGGVTAAKVAHYLALQADNVLVGRWLGAEALGLYGRAREFVAAPAQLLGEALDRVLFPAMAQVQTETRRLAPAFRRGVALIALVMLPSSAVLFVLAPEFIVVILGPQWVRVIVPFQILALGMFLQTSYRISDSLARATGAVYSRAWRQVVFAALVGLGAWVGRDWGIAGVAAGMLAALAANFLLMAQLSLRLVGLTWRRFWDAHRPALYLAVATGAVAWALREVLLRATTLPIVVVAVTLAGSLGCALLLARTSPQVFLGPDGRWLLDTIRTYGRTVRRLPAARPVAVPLVIELVGPAGAGKSTLAQALCRRDPTIPRALGVWALPLPALIRSAIALLLAGVAPSAARHPFSWIELKQLIRLHALHRAVGRAAAQGGRLVVLDEGPVFALSWLRVRCRVDPASSPFAALWRRVLAQWAETLDAVVTLDAPDPVLAERIRTRARPHAVKHEAPGHIYPFLAHYRAAIAEAVASLPVNGTRRITLATADEPPDRTAGRLLAAFAADAFAAERSAC